MKAKGVNKEREGKGRGGVDQQSSTKMWKAACFLDVMCGSAKFPPRRTKPGAQSQSLSRWLSLFFISGEAYK